jgi:hypothetical protein
VFDHDQPARADAFPYLHKQDTYPTRPGIVGGYGPHLLHYQCHVTIEKILAMLNRGKRGDLETPGGPAG